jgi:hypothetical protein
MITSQSVDADSVILRLEDSQRLSPAEYCLVVTATNGLVMAMLTGSFIVTGNSKIMISNNKHNAIIEIVVGCHC